jgi:ferrochelatase
MAYGTPSSDEDIEAYLADIRGGQKPAPSAVKDLKERYKAIGGKSPLLEITLAQASKLETVLNSQGISARVYVAMKHWHPYIREVVPMILGAGYRRIIALTLAPHYSKMSIGGYKRALQDSLKGTHHVEVEFIDSWYGNPIFHRAVAERITCALNQFQPNAEVHVMFTAHSLPERILDYGDPYPKQLAASCQAIADLLKITHWSFAYQSAGHTSEKWLGPDIRSALDVFSNSAEHCRNVLVVPVGFVADHLEILYDIDVEAQGFANRHDLNLRRIESLNTSSMFISALADVVKSRVSIA